MSEQDQTSQASLKVFAKMSSKFPKMILKKLLKFASAITVSAVWKDVIFMLKKNVRLHMRKTVFPMWGGRKQLLQLNHRFRNPKVQFWVSLCRPDNHLKIKNLHQHRNQWRHPVLFINISQRQRYFLLFFNKHRQHRLFLNLFFNIRIQHRRWLSLLFNKHHQHQNQWDLKRMFNKIHQQFLKPRELFRWELLPAPFWGLFFPQYHCFFACKK